MCFVVIWGHEPHQEEQLLNSSCCKEQLSAAKCIFLHAVLLMH